MIRIDSSFFSILRNWFTNIRSLKSPLGIGKKNYKSRVLHLLLMNEILQEELEMIISEQSDTHSPPFAEDGFLSDLRQQKVAPPKGEKDV